MTNSIMRDEMQSKLAPVFAFSPAMLDEKRNLLVDVNQFVQNFDVKDEASLEQANKLCRELIEEKKALEEMRTSVTKPLNQALKTFNGFFKPLMDLCEGAEQFLKKQKIGKYVTEQRRLQEQAYQAAALAHQAGAHAEAQSALAVASSAATAAPAGTSVREVWRAEVVNMSLIPLDFLEVNQTKLQAYARSTPADQLPVLPGVRFVKEPIVTVRTAT